MLTNYKTSNVKPFLEKEDKGFQMSLASKNLEVHESMKPVNPLDLEPEKSIEPENPAEFENHLESENPVKLKTKFAPENLKQI